MVPRCPAATPPPPTTGYEHITQHALGVGARSLIEYHNIVLHVPVHEIQTEVVATARPPWIALHQAVYGFGCLQECHTVLPERREGKWLCYWPDPSQPAVMCMEMGNHKSRNQICSALPTHHHMMLPCSVRASIPRYSPIIRCGRVSPVNGTRLIRHHHYLFHVRSEPNLSK